MCACVCMNLKLCIFSRQQLQCVCVGGCVCMNLRLCMFGRQLLQLVCLDVYVCVCVHESKVMYVQ